MKHDFDDNIVLLTDSYKLSHYKQYPPGTQYVESYFECRSGGRFDYSVFFGLQYLLKKYLSGIVVTRDKINEAKLFHDAHMGSGEFNEVGWNYILEKHNGKLPIEIDAVREGTRLPESNIAFRIRNTDPNCWWLTNYLETLLCHVWYPITVGTLSNVVHGNILAGLEYTGDTSLIDFKLHCFGFRGSTTVESAGIGNLAHLINFKGTDTLPGILCGMRYYYSGVCGYSIPASEHSTITSWGRNGELDAFANMLEQYPEGLVACVSDSFDIREACSTLWGEHLKDEILNRDGTLVVRPDSGDIVSMSVDVFERLADKFGYETNSKGFKVLHPKVRIIQGDGCNVQTINNVINAYIDEGISLDNIAFGMGGGLLQKVNRDTLRCAFKCSSVTVNGEERDVFKQPASDLSKSSKAGRLCLIENDDGRFETVTRSQLNDRSDLLENVFRNGEITRLTTLDEVRAVAHP